MATVVRLRASGSSPNIKRYTSTESVLASGASGNNSRKDFCVSPKLLLRVLAESSTFTTSVPPWPLRRTGIPRGLGFAPVKLGAPISCWNPCIERVPVKPIGFPRVMTSLPVPALIVKVELALAIGALLTMRLPHVDGVAATAAVERDEFLPCELNNRHARASHGRRVTGIA